MTTIPATILGLLRHCSPITANIAGWGKVSGVVRESNGKLWAHVAVGGVEVLVSRQVDADTFGLDLTDPTGQFHACLYLAQKLTLPTAGGVTWHRVDAGWRDRDRLPRHYILTARGENWQEEDCAIFCGTGDDAYQFHSVYPATIIQPIHGIESAESNTEALRLAVLAVVGVEG